MALLGEIKTAKERGQKGGTKYILVECVDCHKERWSALRNGEKRNKRCRHCAMLGSRHWHWKGGRKVSGGYVHIFLQPDDFFYSMADKRSYVKEHRLVIAKHLGRCLHIWELVHHRNGNRGDNRLENLQLVTDDRHMQITILETKIKHLEKQNLELLRQLDERNSYQRGSLQTC